MEKFCVNIVVSCVVVASNNVVVSFVANCGVANDGVVGGGVSVVVGGGSGASTFVDVVVIVVDVGCVINCGCDVVGVGVDSGVVNGDGVVVGGDSVSGVGGDGFGK
jgi:hypothetical protein